MRSLGMADWSRDPLLSTLIKNPGASEGAISQLTESLGMPLPKDYLDLIRLANGAEGPIGPSGYLIFYRGPSIHDLLLHIAYTT